MIAWWGMYAPELVRAAGGIVLIELHIISAHAAADRSKTFTYYLR